MAADFTLYLPKFLSCGEKDAIKDQLRDFPENFQYYSLKTKEPEIGQGDGVVVPKMVLLDKNNEVHEYQNVKCLVLSNTCDISLKNKRVSPPRMVLAPILSLTKLQKIYSVNAIDAIRSQSNTSIFYLPGYEGNDQEFFVQFDRIFTIPRSFIPDGRERILFRLTQQGFYLLLMKSSINFCRFGEGPDLKRGITFG